MKQLLAVLFRTGVLLLCPLFLSAFPVKDDLHMKAVSLSGMGVPAQSVLLSVPGEDVSLGIHVFAGGGYVITAGSTAVPPIIGYSHNARVDFPLSEGPFGSFLRSVVKRMVAVELSFGNEVHPVWRDILHNRTAGFVLYENVVERVGPLLVRNGNENTWNQSAPYNRYTPLESGNPTHVGCGALSMSQILWYWEYPARGNGTYETIDYGSAEYQWDLMPVELTGSSTEQEIDAVATLLYHVGVGIDMRYHSGSMPSNSHPFDYVDFLAARMSFHAELEDSFDYYGDDAYQDMELLLKNELDNIPDEGVPDDYINRPVQFNAMKARLPDDSEIGGHSFVCDGYENRGVAGAPDGMMEGDSDYYFHFNFGWNGEYNGYFKAWAIGPVHDLDLTFRSPYRHLYKMYPAPTSCDTVFCSGHGMCDDSDETIECVCDPGYTARGVQCLSDNGDTGDSADTGNTSDSGDTGDSANTADTGNSADTADSADTGNTGNTADTGDTTDTANTGSSDDSDYDDSDDADGCGDDENADADADVPAVGENTSKLSGGCSVTSCSFSFYDWGAMGGVLALLFVFPLWLILRR